MFDSTDRSKLFAVAEEIITQVASDTRDRSSSYAKWLRVLDYGKGQVNPYEVASEFLGSPSHTMFRDTPTVDLATMVAFIDLYKQTLGPSVVLSDILRNAADSVGPHNNYTEATALVFVLVFTEVVKEMFSEPATT